MGFPDSYPSISFYILFHLILPFISSAMSINIEQSIAYLMEVYSVIDAIQYTYSRLSAIIYCPYEAS